MSVTPQKHEVTASEIADAKKIGFEIENNTTETPEQFINRAFPHFNLFLFLKAIDTLLLPHCPKPPDRLLILNDSPPRLEIDYSTEGFELALRRTFYYDAGDIHVSHDLLILPVPAQNNKIGKQVNRLCLQQYVNMGARKILVHAALDIGGYAWAKSHFTALHRKEMDVILDNANLQLTDIQFKAVKRIYDNYYTQHPTGTAFPIVKWAELPFMKNVLIGSNWQGSVDLQDKEQFSNFIDHVFN